MSLIYGAAGGGGRRSLMVALLAESFLVTTLIDMPVLERLAEQRYIVVE